MDDEAIIALYFARDESAITETKNKYGHLVQRIASHLLTLPEDREECESDTYMSLWDTIPPAHPSPFVAYLSRIARNIAISFRRKQTAEKRKGDLYAASLEELAEVLPSPALDEHFSAKELGACIDRFLEKTEKENRILFIRRYFFGESVQELAKDFSLRENLISARLSRTRKKLRDYLRKEGFSL